MAKLTEQKKLFCKEYLIDLNGTQAAIRAGYSEKTAQEQSSRLLSTVIIQDFIRDLSKARNDELDYSAKDVLKRHIEIDEMDVADILDDQGNMRAIKDWPKSWRTTISGIDLTKTLDNEGMATVISKIKWPDKLKNIELLGKHVNVQAYGANIMGLGDEEITSLRVEVIDARSDKRK